MPVNIKLRNIIIVAVYLTTLFSCERIENLSPRHVNLHKTIVLAHRATGDSDKFRNNTLEGATYGFNNLDGIEVDIAISKDNGLWLTHDRKVKSIDKYFINVNDYDIASVKDDNGKPYYNKLEDVLAYMSEYESEKYISLDVKNPFTLFTNSIFNDVAEAISLLTAKYNLEGKVLLESNSLSFLKMIRNKSQGVGTYYMCFGNFDKGIRNVYRNELTGISFDYGRKDIMTEQSVDLAHKLGIKVLVYTINNEEISKVYPLNVDIVETDNMNFYQLLEKK